MNIPTGSREGVNLLKLKNYCVITFPNSHSALFAERTFQGENGIGFMVTPGQRPNNSGCGISIRITVQDCGRAVKLMQEKAVVFSGIYNIDKLKETVTKLM